MSADFDPVSTIGQVVATTDLLTALPCQSVSAAKPNIAAHTAGGKYPT